MIDERARRVWNGLSFLFAALVLAWSIRWFWQHGWPNPYHLLDMRKFQIMLFFGAPSGVLLAIVAFFRGGKK